MAEQKKIVGASHSPNYGTRNQPRTKANKVHNSSTCHEAGSIEDLPPFSEHIFSDSVMSQYQDLVSQQAQAAAAITVLGSAVGKTTEMELAADNSMTSDHAASTDDSSEKQPAEQLTTTSSCRRRSAKERVEKYKCNICSYRSKWSHGLSNHMRRHNNTLFKCAECDYSTPWKGDLTNHMRLHSGNMFQCPHCSFKTYRKQGLDKHIVIHSGSKPHECPHCTYRSSQPGNLKKHLMTHTGEKPISCELCSYRCRQTTQLRQHLEQHHNGVLPPSLDPNNHNKPKLFRKSFTCALCRRTWASKANFTRHMKIQHNSEGPFKCGFVCPSSFFSQVECLEHQITHNNHPITVKKTADASTNTDCSLSPSEDLTLEVRSANDSSYFKTSQEIPANSNQYNTDLPRQHLVSRQPINSLPKVTSYTQHQDDQHSQSCVLNKVDSQSNPPFMANSSTSQPGSHSNRTLNQPIPNLVVSQSMPGLQPVSQSFYSRV